MCITLLIEARRDIERILRELQQILDSGELSLHSNANTLRQVITEISARHLAKEDTLLQTLNDSFPKDVGEARVFHLLVDDLTHVISSGGYHDETIVSHIGVLKLLLQHHFFTAESMLLDLAANVLTDEKQIELGKCYRENYQKYCRQICQKNVKHCSILPKGRLT